MSIYLCYDLRAIQSFIFKIPKLKYIVGGSALIDLFDRDVAPTCGGVGATRIFCAGGKGAFLCENEELAAGVKLRLREKARERGLDIRFGMHKEYSEASHNADELYPYVPSVHELDGHPCALSGLYPVGVGRKDGEHPVVRRRVEEATQRHFENRLLTKGIDLGPGGIGVDDIEFVRALGDETDEERAGLAAFDERRRWAIVCMDGNDMGRQFRHQHDRLRTKPEVMQAWVQRVSAALDTCSMEAARRGIEQAIQRWLKGPDNRRVDQCSYEEDGRRRLVVPIRPLVVGGDDIVLLCHPKFAMEFVRAASSAWETVAQREASRYRDDHRDELWPATGNRITISAGVLFAPATLPLHAAIPYAELLLASAKSSGRTVGEGKPSEPCIDWECVTETMVDTPAARRQRELVFVDDDLGQEKVCLSSKPYALKELDRISSGGVLPRLPRSLRHEVVEQLRRPFDAREVFRMRIEKRHPELAKLLDEGEGKAGSSWHRRRGDGTQPVERSTWICDAIELAEEEQSFEYEEVRT